MTELHFTILEQTPTNFFVQGFLQMFIIVQLVKTFAAPTEPKLKRKPYIESCSETLNSALITLPLLVSFSHLYQGLRTYLFHSGLSTNILYAFLVSPFFFCCSLFDLMSRTMAREVYELWSPSFHDLFCQILGSKYLPAEEVKVMGTFNKYIHFWRTIYVPVNIEI